MWTQPYFVDLMIFTLKNWCILHYISLMVPYLTSSAFLCKKCSWLKLLQPHATDPAIHLREQSCTALIPVKVTAQMLLSEKCPQTQLALNPHCLKQTPEHNKWLVLGSQSIWEWSVPCSGVQEGGGEGGWIVLISFQRDAILWKCCSLRPTVGPLWTARMHF